eukprot:GILK01010284.1.p1 GENE.GILK01010284.1~~GILK01010284.1.p1  ORF type:complete len:513 (+),score=67.72 GILK01010284.1:60-1598(+)
MDERQSMVSFRLPLSYAQENAEEMSDGAYALSMVSPATLYRSQSGRLYVLYPRRWLMLGMFCIQSCLNQMVCYNFAPVSHLTKEHFGHHTKPSWFVTAFFITYVLFSFPATWLVDKFGLRFAVVTGAALQALGVGIRCCADFAESVHEEWWIIMIGQIVVSLAQPFFVNPPPLLAINWFGDTERTLATTLAVVCNPVGIAVAYLIAPLLVHAPGDLMTLLQASAAMCTSAGLVCFLFFRSEPPTPPSHSATVRKKETYGIRELLLLFKEKGFIHTVVAFAVAEAVTNSLSVFLNGILEPFELSTHVIGMMGVLFIFASLIGSGLVGYYVDRTHQYKNSLLLCLLGSCMAMVYLVLSRDAANAIVAVMLTGLFLGPLQPIAVEAAAECTFPSSESALSAVQQVLGNLASAALIPLIASISGKKGADMTASIWLLSGLLLVGFLVYLTFNGSYRRLKLEADRQQLIAAAVKHAAYIKQEDGIRLVHGNAECEPLTGREDEPSAYYSGTISNQHL